MSAGGGSKRLFRKVKHTLICPCCAAAASRLLPPAACLLPPLVLLHQVGNKSSEYYPDVHEVRKSGSYIYEEFMKTQGVDVKVYTVGPNYGHAEARKSPVIDGKVNRNDDGSEVRYPVLLSQAEKTYANKVANPSPARPCLEGSLALACHSLLRRSAHNGRRRCTATVAAHGTGGHGL